MSTTFKVIILTLFAGVLWIVVMPCVSHGPPPSLRSTARNHAAQLQTAVELYSMELGELPPLEKSGNATLMRILTGSNKSSLVYFEPGSLDAHGNYLDPWGVPFRYLQTEDGLIVYSSGANKINERGQGDDIEGSKRTQ